MTKRHWSDRLVAMGACADAVEWARTQPSFAAAWRTCTRGDWMLWLAGRLIGTPGSLAHRRVVKAAAGCARLALPIFTKWYPTDDRPLQAIVAAERWAQTPSAVNRQAAYAAASASAAASAAAAASDAADAAGAAYAASDAADAADAKARSLARSAAVVRRIIPCPRLPVWASQKGTR